MPDSNLPDDATRARPKPASSPETSTGASTGAWTAGGVSPTSSGTPGRLGRFEIRQVLGEGAFGCVYLAFDPELERQVAIKVPHRDGLTPAFRDRFLREARATATIHHPNVCPVYDVGTDGDLPYIVMHFVVGGTLGGLLDKLAEPLPPRHALAIARKLALGMAAAHSQGVIHRDLKPQNILYDKASREVLITDFGLARIGSVARQTTDGAVFGTPAYMAPEQARGKQEEVGPLSDVYALGVILYRMLTGDVPFHGSVFEIMMQHVEAAPRPPSEVRSGLDPKLDMLVLKALAKAPADRYRSAKDFATALADHLRGADAAEPGPVPPVVTVPPSPAPEPLPVPEPTEAVETVRDSGRGSRGGKRPSRRRRPERRPTEPEFDPEDEPAPRKRSLLRWVLIVGGSIVGLYLFLVIVFGLVHSSRPYPTYTDPDANKGTYEPPDYNPIKPKAGFGDSKSAK